MLEYSDCTASSEEQAGWVKIIFRAAQKILVSFFLGRRQTFFSARGGKIVGRSLRPAMCSPSEWNNSWERVWQAPRHLAAAKLMEDLVFCSRCHLRPDRGALAPVPSLCRGNFIVVGDTMGGRRVGVSDRWILRKNSGSYWNKVLAVEWTSGPTAQTASELEIKH